jgi:urease accessory protein
VTALPRLLQLVSPSLPIGGYAYSDGLETAVARSWITSESDARAWIAGRMRESLGQCELPILLRLLRAAAARDGVAFARWCDTARAVKDSEERRFADREQGAALLRLLRDLEVPGANELADRARPALAASFALAATAWGIAERDALIGYGYAFMEAQIAAAVKLVPLGQTAGQRICGERVRLFRS